MADVQLTAYNVKTKEKNVPIMDAVVTKTAKGAYMVQGHDGYIFFFSLYVISCELNVCHMIDFSS